MKKDAIKKGYRNFFIGIGIDAYFSVINEPCTLNDAYAKIIQLEILKIPQNKSLDYMI